MRPAKGDYSEYYQQYIDLVKDDNILKVLTEQNKETQNILNSFPKDKGEFRYAEGKWTIKEIIGHLMDVERIFAYRALSIARGEKKSLPGFDQDEYAKNGMFNQGTLSDLNYEFRLLRECNILLFKGLDKSVWQNRGLANDTEVTVLALMYMIAGHEKHHTNILNERYK
jgi:uncharacterized damage-inducible protein DinB